MLVEREGLIPGNRVLLRGPNGAHLFAAWLGVLKAGGIVVATMPLLRPAEIGTIVARGRISLRSSTPASASISTPRRNAVGHGL